MTLLGHRRPLVSFTSSKTGTINAILATRNVIKGSPPATQSLSPPASPLSNYYHSAAAAGGGGGRRGLVAYQCLRRRLIVALH